MFWPIGMPAGELRDLAMESRDFWLTLSREAGVWMKPCGSLQIAQREDELQVLREFAERAPDLGISCQLLTPREARLKSPAVNIDSCIGALFSPDEACINSRHAVHQTRIWLTRRFGIALREGTAVEVDWDHTRLADQTIIAHDRAVVCSGAEIEALFPAEIAATGLRICKLQMLKTVQQPPGWDIGCHLASGLSLRHYKSFEICPSISALRDRVASETPELDRFGIHVMAAQNDEGEVLLGDSHEYGPQPDPFDKAEIEHLILRELRKFITLPDWTIAERWSGFYAKHPLRPSIHLQPRPHVHLVTGVGGAGMTLSFAAAERMWSRWSIDLEAVR
jgi:FAD dependent oxidoreductase TIGR03364